MTDEKHRESVESLIAGQDASMFVSDLLDQLDAVADVVAVDTSHNKIMDANTLARISEEKGLEMPSKEVANSRRASVNDPEAEKRNAELLAERKAELVGKTVTGRLKVSNTGRKGYFIKWSEHDNDTIYVSNARATQFLGPNPPSGLWVKCTIVDLGPTWAPWDRQHPYTQTLVPAENPNKVSPRAQTPGPPARFPSRQNSVDPRPVKSAECTPSPRSADVQAKSWALIQQALTKGQLPQVNAIKSWDLVKEAILAQTTAPVLKEDKSKMPRNRRSSAFACRQHRRSDMGNARTSWRRGGAMTPEPSSCSSSPKSQPAKARTPGPPSIQRSNSRRSHASAASTNSRFGSLRRYDTPSPRRNPGSPRFQR